MDKPSENSASNDGANPESNSDSNGNKPIFWREMKDIFDHSITGSAIGTIVFTVAVLAVGFALEGTFANKKLWWCYIAIACIGNIILFCAFYAWDRTTEPTKPASHQPTPLPSTGISATQQADSGKGGPIAPVTPEPQERKEWEQALTIPALIDVIHAHLLWLDLCLKKGDKNHPRAEVYARYAIETSRRFGVNAPTPFPEQGTMISKDIAWYESLDRAVADVYRFMVEGRPSSTTAPSKMDSDKPPASQVTVLSDEQRSTFKQLRQTFESLALQSKGLYHALVECKDTRDGSGNALSDVPAGLHNGGHPSDPYAVLAYQGITDDPMYPKALTDEERASVAPAKINDEFVRDAEGKAWARWILPVHRSGFLYGDYEAVAKFNSLAEAAGNALKGLSIEAIERLPKNVRRLCRHTAPGNQRYWFGEIPKDQKVIPPRPARFQNGVIEHCPGATSESGGRSGAWLLLVHRLAWDSPAGSPLKASRWFWRDNASVSYSPTDEHSALEDHVPIHRFYSVFGRSVREATDISLASAWAIDRLLHLLDASIQGEAVPASQPTPAETAISEKRQIDRRNPGRTYEVIKGQLGNWPQGAVFTEHEFRKAHPAVPPNLHGADPVTFANDYFDEQLEDHMRNGVIRVIA